MRGPNSTQILICGTGGKTNLSAFVATFLISVEERKAIVLHEIEKLEHKLHSYSLVNVTCGAVVCIGSPISISLTFAPLQGNSATTVGILTTLIAVAASIQSYWNPSMRRRFAQRAINSYRKILLDLDRLAAFPPKSQAACNAALLVIDEEIAKVAREFREEASGKEGGDDVNQQPRKIVFPTVPHSFPLFSNSYS